MCYTFFKILHDMDEIDGALLYCKPIISLVVFFHFKILILQIGVKWLKMPKNDKSCVCHVLYLRNHTLCNYHLWYICVK